LAAAADALAAEVIASSAALTSRGSFTPLPVLGLPGWYDGNEHAEFYANRDYFRTGYRAARKGTL
jgi:hypothetical protein